MFHPVMRTDVPQNHIAVQTVSTDELQPTSSHVVPALLRPPVKSEPFRPIEPAIDNMVQVAKYARTIVLPEMRTNSLTKFQFFFFQKSTARTRKRERTAGQIVSKLSEKAERTEASPCRRH